jgi:hypothetical protein
MDGVKYCNLEESKAVSLVIYLRKLGTAHKYKATPCCDQHLDSGYLTS